MATVNAINVVDWATRLSYSADTQEIGWQKTIVLGQRGRHNPFSGLIGGIEGMKPITQVMDFRALKGQQIVVTLDRPLGGAGTQGPASLQRVVGREENVRHATYRCTVGLMAHMVAGEQLVQTETVIGTDWDNRQRKKLTEWFAWKQGDDIQFEMIVKSHARNTVYPNNKTSVDQLGTADYLNLATVTRNKEILNANQAGPFDISRSESGAEILTYLLMGPSKAYSGMSASNSYQQLLSNADMRGDNNKLFKGGLPRYLGTHLYDWAVEDGTQVGPLAAPCAPIAYLGVALPTNGTTAPYQIQGGGNAINAADTSNPLFFQYYGAAQYIGHEGIKQAATTNVTYYLAAQIITGADTGKIAFFSYQVNNGNQITVLNRLDPSTSGILVPTLGSMTYAGMTALVGVNGFQGVSTGAVPVGSILYQVNAKGVPYVRTFGFGRNAILTGYGALAANQGYGSGGGSPGQRLFEAQDAGRLFSVGWQQVWGSTATQDANNMTNAYTMTLSAYQPNGWPDIV